MNAIRPLVGAPCGKIAGLFEDGQAVFKGIPYAAAPVAELRWRAPQLLPDFPDIFYADRYGKSCPQPANTWLYVAPEEMSEDCLYLNIRAPRMSAGSELLPVAVQIHGGGYTIGTGANDAENGSNFVEKDIIFVTINYRLGAYGFLYLDEFEGAEPGSGSLGIQDQIAALRWIRRNIEAFGGNPENITIMGCSAGGGSVSSLMVAPQAKGLFCKAIAQSGSLRLTKSADKARAVAQTFMRFAGVNTIAELRETPGDKLFEIYAKTLKKYGFTSKETAFAPVRDGIILPEEPVAALEHGVAAGIALLAGTTKDEMNGFKHISWVTRFLSFKVFKWLVPKDVAEYFGRLDDIVADFYNKHYRMLSKADRFFKAATTGVFLMPQLHMAVAQCRYAPVYFYRFDWGGKDGALHGSESPFVFGHYDSEIRVDGELRLPPMTVVRALHESWAGFISCGNPAAVDTVGWKEFDDENYATMLLNECCKLVHDPDKVERVFWEELGE